MKKGFIHIYCGDGKGKTTSAMGLALRAAGYGMKVLIYQFMKDNTTSERKILKEIPNVTILNGLDSEKFSFQMNDQEKKQHKQFNTERFDEITKKAKEEDFDMILMDELIYTIRAGLIEEELVTHYLKTKPENLEVILTGNPPSESLIALADYVSEIKKIKHPFDRGQIARFGIEK